MIGYADYRWLSSDPTCVSAYLWHPILRTCRKIGAKRILDVGCGNGALAAFLAGAGFDVEGCDSSIEGIRVASAAHPNIRFHRYGVDDDAALSGFDTVVSTEVIEHLYLPRQLPRFAARVLSEGGHLIVSTPYHGYLKNLLISLLGRWDRHLDPFWDGGHIKFWSRATLTRLLTEEGFAVTEFVGTGRAPYLWKSMLITARRTR